MKLKDIERTMELLHEHINGVERAQLVADRMLEEQLSEQVSQLRGLVVRLTNMIIHSLEENGDGEGPWDWSQVGDTDMKLLRKLWHNHRMSIHEATQAGDFLTERVLAEMRDSAKDCVHSVVRSWNEYKDTALFQAYKEGSNG